MCIFLFFLVVQKLFCYLKRKKIIPELTYFYRVYNEKFTLKLSLFFTFFVNKKVAKS